MAGKGKGGNTVAAVWEIAAPVAEQLGLSIWDIRFQKEGVSWYLRIYIDKEGGVGITDCENFSRAVDGPLDEADPIEQSYYLEVSSPGVERQLTRDEHFKKYIGSTPMQFIVGIRINNAQMLLETTTYSINESAISKALSKATTTA